MDPISVSASILGLLGAATKVSEVLTKFIRSLKDAPRSARRLVTEVDDLKLCFQCFHQLQDYVVSEHSSASSRKTMIMLDHLCVILTHCVMVFSELEHVLDGLIPRNRISIGNRLRTVLKQLHEIQGSKPTRAESEEARHAVLTGLVDTFRCGLLQTVSSGIIGDLQGVLHVLTYVSVHPTYIPPNCAFLILSQASGVLSASGKEEILREERLPAVLDILCQLWEMDEIRGAIESGVWEAKIDNIP
ncbi:MAG: hypothetical protein Q9173_006749 [Seirophora scorigena]